MNLTPERWQHVARSTSWPSTRTGRARRISFRGVRGRRGSSRREVESLLGQDAERRPGSVGLGNRGITVRSWSGLDFGRGTALGPYRIEGSLGAGGMGEVFRATDTRLESPGSDQSTAERVPRLDQQMRARFAREARAVAALTHPHICTLYDVGRHRRVDFLVMEYLEGETLAARLADGRLSLDDDADVCDRDRQRARPRASPRDRPSRSEARQHHADGERREAARFRRREIPAGRECRRMQTGRS